MPEAFVIHVSADDAAVTPIRETLTAAGIDTWVDHWDCQGAKDDWERQNREALNTCQYGFFILSAESANSTECREQCQAILDEGKRLYIISIESVPLNDFPDPSYTVRYIDLTRDPETNMTKLVRAVRSQYDPESQPTAIQDRAIGGSFPRYYLRLPLIGRDSDLSVVQKALADGHRVTSIVGLSGVGKTRLAVEIVNTVTFQDGVIWLTMSEYTTVADLTTLIRNHLGLDVSADLSSVWAALGKRQVLIVLDGAEACAQRQAYADQLNMLDLSGGTRVLMTSRQRWTELRDVKFHDLHVPDLNVALTILRAMCRREPPARAIKGFEEELVKAACCRPRLLEYVVRWADVYPPEYILEILRTRRGDDAEQAFDELVNRDIRQIENNPGWPQASAALRRLSICRGSFTFDAARILIGEPRSLKLLKEWGLVTQEAMRYTIDPLMLPSIEPDENARPAHFTYYLSLASQCAERQQYKNLDPEADNLNAAFEWAIASGRLESALQLANACSEFLANRGLYDQRSTWYERIAAKMPQHPVDHPQNKLQAAVQIGLGIAYLGRLRGDRRTNLQRAVTALGRAARFFTPQRAPLDYASIQNNLGLAYRSLSEVEDYVQNLRLAVTAFGHAARYYAPAAHPLEFAVVQNNLGATYITLSASADRKNNLRNAIQAFRRALTFLKAEEAPLYFALTHNNLGIAYAELAELEEGETRTENLRRAMTAFQRAGRFLTEDHAPMHYAQVLNNMGHVCRNLANWYGEPDNLHKAIAAYGRALQFWTLEEAPSLHAATQISLGYASLDLADMEDAPTHLQRAADAFQQALKVYTPRVHASEYYKTKVTLGVVLKKLGNLSEAVSCWREAEHYFRSMGQIDMAERMNRWINGESDPAKGPNNSKWIRRSKY
jgi:tetratricopeptide (TPR) repeat protein